MSADACEFGHLGSFSLVGKFAALSEIANIRHAITTATSDRCDMHSRHSDYPLRRRGLADALGAKSIAWARQIHSGIVTTAEICGEGKVDADAVITNASGQAVMCLTADCPIVLLADIKTPAIAAIHCGWRSVAASIVQNTLGEMARRFDCHSEDMLAVICPAAQKCCYEVGPEVIEAVSGSQGELSADMAESADDGKFMLSLPTVVNRALTAAGIKSENIEQSGYCSICDQRFHSYRRDGEKAGRAAAAIVFDLSA